MIYLILILLIFIIGIYLFVKVVSKLLKSILTAVVIILFILSGLVLLTYFDYRNIEQGFVGSPITILLEDNGNYLCGGKYILKDLKLNETIDIYNLNNRSYKNILNNSFKLIIINISFLEKNLNSSLSWEDYNISKEELIETFRYENQDLFIPKTFKIDKNTQKTEIFSIILSKLLEEKGYGIFIEGYKEKDLIIYKEPFIFKFLKLL